MTTLLLVLAFVPVAVFVVRRDGAERERRAWMWDWWEEIMREGEA